MRSNATRTEIEHAAELAALHDDIARFPHGYETMVGARHHAFRRAAPEGGDRALAVDRKAAVAVGRCCRPSTPAPTQILSHLRGELQGNRPRTAIIVSHRLSAVADADMIIVLKAGRVVERGSHDQLLSIDGWYAAQWRYQQLEASLEAA